MTTGGSAFPITGVVGVIGGSDEEVGRQLACLEGLPALGGVEIRADLFATRDAPLALTERLRDRWPVLFTVRLAAEGGAYRASESERIELYSEALRRGAVLLDVELRSGAASALAGRGAPLLVSHHDFHGTIGREELEDLTAAAATLAPLGIKIVPTAARPLDGLRMLEWVAARRATEPRRAGFAMGERGVFSRILSLAWGAPLTYGSLTARVAPGQLSARDLLETYRAPIHTRSTRIFGVAGNPVHHSLSPHLHNPAFAARRLDAVYVPLELTSFSDLLDLAEPLGIAGVSVTIPFKKDAFENAASTDAPSKAGRATNTLIWERSE
ncbi:MAG: type I 3-dehydroquinate dehydratase, partial [Myxococcota bacterium]